MALILKHQSVEAFVSRVREAYREGDPDTLVKIARFLIAGGAWAVWRPASGVNVSVDMPRIQALVGL